MIYLVQTILIILLLNELVTNIRCGLPNRPLNNLPLVLATLNSLKDEASHADATSVASDDNTCNITTIIEKSSGQIKSVNHPDPYPTNCQWTYVIRVGTEHKILLKVVDWDLDTDNGDELSIQPISSKNKSSNSESHVISLSDSNNSASTTTTTTADSFEMDNLCCDTAIITFKVGNHSNNHTGFLLKYLRQDEATTQTPPIGVPGWHQVYLCGMSIHEFNQHEEEFRRSLIDSAEKYSKENGIIPENGKIKLNQIIINLVVQCPTSWPSSANCLQVNFSVKLEENEVPTELKSEHLEEMWDVYRDTDELSHLGLWEYEIPNVQWLFWFWIGLLCFLSLFFSFLLIIIVKTKLISYYFLRLKLTNSQQVNSSFISWQQQNNMMMPLFTAENAQRLQFVRTYEKLNNIQPSSSCQNGTSHNADQGNLKVESEDLEQEDDQHIYQTLTSVIRTTENSRVSIISETTEDSKSIGSQTCKNTQRNE